MLVTLRGNETAVFCWFCGNLTTPAAGRRGVWMWPVASLRQQLAIYIQMCARHKGKGLGNRYAVQYLWLTLMILTDLCIFAAFHFCQTAEPGNEPCFSVRRERVSKTHLPSPAIDEVVALFVVKYVIVYSLLSICLFFIYN